MSLPVDPGSPAAVRPGTVATLRPALLVIVLAASLLCVLETVLLRYPFPALVWLLASLPATGLLYVLAGAWAWDRRPSNRMGLWLVAIGMSTIVARLSLVEDPWLATAGLVLAQTPIAGVVLLMLVFPSGRLSGALDRGVAVAAFVITVGFAIPMSVFRPDDATAALRLADRPELVSSLAILQSVAWWALLAVVVVISVRRLRAQRAVRGERRARMAVYLTGIASALLLPLVAQLGQGFGWSELAVFAVQVGLLASVPLVFTTALLSGGYGRTGRLDELAGWLGSSRPGPQELRQALADTLGDDSLQLLFRRSGTAEVVDTDGRIVAEPVPRPPTGVAVIALSGGSAALISYDTAAVPDPAMVAAAGGVLAVALDRDRLTAELLAEREQLKRSRARIVEVGDAERRRLARDLHDGLQGRLVLAAIRAGSLASAPDLTGSARQSAYGLRTELEQTVDALRRLVHGVLPALLMERGLVPAARDLVERCGIASRLRCLDGEPDLPPAVASSAYFVVAEAITNAVKHAHASRLDVVIGMDHDRVRIEIGDDGRGGADPRGGAGLRGMADRIEALDGRFELHSSPTTGTRVIALIPCAQPQSAAA